MFGLYVQRHQALACTTSANVTDLRIFDSSCCAIRFVLCHASRSCAAQRYSLDPRSQPSLHPRFLNAMFQENALASRSERPPASLAQLGGVDYAQRSWACPNYPTGRV